MKNPFPVNLQTSAEVRQQGWQAESRDADGHLISCHAPIEADDPGIAEWIVECTSRGETVTFWPTNGEIAATQTPPPQTHVALQDGTDWTEVCSAMTAKLQADDSAPPPTKHVVVDTRIAELEAEIKRLKSERSYIVGCNDGFEEAISQAATVAYRSCAETRHVTLGEKAAAAIRAIAIKDGT